MNKSLEKGIVIELVHLQVVLESHFVTVANDMGLNSNNPMIPNQNEAGQRSELCTKICFEENHVHI